MKKFMSLMAFALLPVFGILFTALPAYADSPGQLSNGPSNYKVRNVTQNGAYAQSVSAACNETVKYSITLANSDYGLLKNLTVKADLASGVINASATNVNNQTTSVSGSAKATATQGNLSYVAGSTVRIASDGTTTTPVADGITNGGINVGNLNGSTYVFVQFQAKVNCPSTPKEIQVCELATKKIVTIDEKDFDSSKYSKNLDDCKETVKYIKVCELATKKIVTIDEKSYDSSKYSKNLADCATPPAPGEITVCRLSDKTVMNIKENEYDSKLYTKDLSQCAAAPVTPVTPGELPHTGATGAIVVIASLLTAAAGYVVTGRKNLLG